MRDLKFRAWDDNGEIMYYSDKEYEDCHFGFHEGRVVAWFRQTEPGTIDEPPYDYGEPVEAMQYAGLKDKNGVGMDWWEGDLLRKGTQHPNNAIAKIVYNRRLAQWEIVGRSGSPFCTLAEACENGWKKVGDIHQNPELLK